jgi:hypothetical protein
MKAFLARFRPLLVAVLCGFDRLRFRGDSRLLNHTSGVHSYCHQQRILHKDFPKHAQHLTDILRAQTEADARHHGVPLRHLDSPNLNKEAVARELAHQHRRRNGRLAVLTCVESCSVYRPRKNQQGLLELRQQQGKCLHYYHYFHDDAVGPGYVRLQSWFPFTVHIGLNGRSWLCQQLRQRKIRFRARDNLLVHVADWEQAQALLDAQRQTDWPALLDRLTRPLQPLWQHLQEVARTPYYWMAEQTEWATDLLFRDPSDLARWYALWLQHGITVLSCQDVLRYLGKHVPETGYGNCKGEVSIDRRDRGEGARLKMWHRHNSLKVYDKEGVALRVETTINQPKDFRVWRQPEGAKPEDPKSWQQMRKGVADLDRRAAVSQSANNRLLESLASVTETTPLGVLLRPLTEPVVAGSGRRVRGLRPWSAEDGAMLRCVSQGEFLLHGFRNRDVRQALYPATEDKTEQRRQASQVTRRLALLRAHGLIVKVQKTHRYQLSAEGRRVTTALLNAEAADVNALAAAAAA